MTIRRSLKSVFGWFGLSSLLLLASFTGGIQADTQGQSAPNPTLLGLGALAILASLIGLVILFFIVWRARKGGSL